MGSQSETINKGTLCNLTNSLTYNLASFSIEALILISKKSADFVNRSTMTQTALLPFFL